MTFIRYQNQELSLSEFSLLKTGNIITFLYFIFNAILLIITFSSNKKIANKQLYSLFLIFLLSLIILVVIYLISDRQLRIIFSGINLIFNIFVLSQLILITFFKKESLYLGKSIFLTSLLLILLFALVFSQIYYFEDDSKSYRFGMLKADAGVILGAAVWSGNRPSPVLRRRITKGYQIYIKRIVSKLIVTGGNAPNEMTEAEVAKKELLKYGIKESDLIIEKFSSSTSEQIQYIRDNLYKKNNWERIILISDNFHLLRASEICDFNNVNADCIASDNPFSTEGEVSYSIRESFALVVFWLYGIG